MHSPTQLPEHGSGLIQILWFSQYFPIDLDQGITSQNQSFRETSRDRLRFLACQVLYQLFGGMDSLFIFIALRFYNRKWYLQ
jgi:hypothetical protein